MSEHTTEQQVTEPRKRSGNKSAPAKKVHPDRGPLRTFIKTMRRQSSVIFQDGRVLAKFSRRGVCRTRSKKACKRLAADGYVEVMPGQQVLPTPWAEPDPRIIRAVQEELSADEGLNDDLFDDVEDLVEED